MLRCIILPYVKIGQFLVEIFQFFKMAAVSHVELFGTYLDRQRIVLGVLYRRAKLFESTQLVLIIRQCQYLAHLA